jgi:integrase
MEQAVKKHKPRPCKHLNIERVSHEMTDCDFWSENERIRGMLPVDVIAASVKALKQGTVTKDALLSFLRGDSKDSNLVPGQKPILLADFLSDVYLPSRKTDIGSRTLDGELDQVKRLTLTLGKVPVHEITQRHAVDYKKFHQRKKSANISIRQDLNLLKRAMNLAVDQELVKNCSLKPVRGLPANDRTEIWPRLSDIPKLLRRTPPQARGITYFFMLTGARINQALQMTVNEIDWERRVIRIPNSKRRRKVPSRGKKFRTLHMDDLGPRLEWLLKKIIKPDPVSGHLFPGRFPGRPMHAATVEDLFNRAIMSGGFEHLVPQHVIDGNGRDHMTPHDLRGGFCNHGAMARWDFNKLRKYMGQINAASIQAYLDEAQDHRPEESIFVHPPLRIRRAMKNSAATAPVPQPTVAEPVTPYSVEPASQFLN